MQACTHFGAFSGLSCSWDGTLLVSVKKFSVSVPCDMCDIVSESALAHCAIGCCYSLSFVLMVEVEYICGFGPTPRGLDKISWEWP